MERKALKTVAYTNTETGESHSKDFWVDMQFNENGYLFLNRKKSTRSFIEFVLPKEFSWAERGRIQELTHYILKDNQFLTHKANGKIVAIGKDDIGRILEMSERQTKVLILKMKRHKILKEVSFEGKIYFAFNPMYGFKDKRINMNIFVFFQDELRGVLPEWVIEKFLEQVQEIQPDIKLV